MAREKDLRGKRENTGLFGLEEGELGVYILEALILIALLGMMFSVGGTFQWALGVIILTILGGIFASKLIQGTRKLSGWRRDNELDDIVRMELPRTSEMVEGAFKGKELSRAFLEQRLKRNFIVKLKDEKSLDDEELEPLLEDPDELNEIIQDEKITNFLIEGKDYQKLVRKKDWEDEDEGIFSSTHMTVGKKYKKKITDLIERMEDWP